MAKSEEIRKEIYEAGTKHSKQDIKKHWPDYWPSSSYTINQFNNETETIFPKKKKNDNETKTWRQTTFL